MTSRRNLPFTPQSPMMRPPLPPAICVDRLQKMIEVGHLVMFNAGEDLIFEVADIRQILNPGVPPGQVAMQITLRGEFKVHVLAANPNRSLVIVGESRARQEAAAADNGRLGAVAPDPPSGLVLTDSDTPRTQPHEHDLGESPAEQSHEVTQGACSACGDIGPLGTACVDCGTGTYSAPTLGDA